MNNILSTIFKGILAIRPLTSNLCILIAVGALSLIGILCFSSSLRLDHWFWPSGGANNLILFLVLFASVLTVSLVTHFGFCKASIQRAFWFIVKVVIVFFILLGVVVFLNGLQGGSWSVEPINAMVPMLVIGIFLSWLLHITEVSVRISHLIDSAASVNSFN